ncbi:molybdopterin molybdotransferase MoeA [Candidatus Hecatella orcuttiae]|jgi:molybdenum cofactor synthesis domain-containing protein|uniref:molybdopterin molybdotransferase MoeA n=1 Tax=Candidatus Hecatella orcuttiae TaxID=1935119 RepID=UPI002868261C|nr:molybdopterin molybdotransferase MoeA [Candidatus Hecatella orcuttiae]
MKRRFNHATTEEALEKIAAIPSLKPEVEEVALADAYGRVLAEDVVSPEDIPPKHRAFFDGYAVRSSDVKEASKEKPVMLKVAGRIDLKNLSPPPLGLKEAYRVPTGALLPQGADAIIPLEVVEFAEGGEIAVRGKVEEGQYLTAAGKDMVRGATVLRRGRILLAQDLDLLFMFRMKTVKVYRKPKVAILSVGSELMGDLEEEDPSKTPASHSILVQKLVEAAGGAPSYLGVCPDDGEEIGRRLEEALASHDMAATIGGSSVGEADLVVETVNRLGKPGILVYGLKVKPGAVSSLGLVHGKPVALLPGLIQSTLIGFHFLLLPLILAKLGLKIDEYKPTVKARLSSRVDWGKPTEFKRALFVELSREEAGFAARPLRGESSLISPVLASHGYAFVSGSKTSLEAGEWLDVYLLPGLARLEAV